MMDLYRKEKRYASQRDMTLKQMEMAQLQSSTPIRHILNLYENITRKGFDDYTLAESLKRLNQTLQARGNMPRTYSDLSTSEMEINWRFDKVAEDLKYALTDKPTRPFTPYNLARVARELGIMGYKNTEIIPIWLDRVNGLYRRTVGIDPFVDYEEAKIPLEDSMYGGAEGVVAKHYIFQGFQSSDEFAEHLETLKMWEQEREEVEPVGNEVEEIEFAMKKLMEAAANVKDMQKEQEAAMRNLRLQYFKLLEANDKNEFLQEN